MGVDKSRTEESYSDSNRTIGGAIQTVEHSEETRAEMQNLLGSEDQVFDQGLFENTDWSEFDGTFSINREAYGRGGPQVQAHDALWDAAGKVGGFKTYMQTFKIREDQGLMSALKWLRSEADRVGNTEQHERIDRVLRLERIERGDFNQFEKQVDEANELMGQAREAAQAGDSALAQQLMDQAHGMFDYLGAFDVGLTFKEGAFGQAVEALDNPQARLVGEAVWEAGQLKDRSSETYVDMFKNLTVDSINAVNKGLEYGERIIAAELRDVDTQIQNATMSGSSGRGILAKQALLARAADNAAYRKAQLRTEAAVKESNILGQARNFMETFRVQYAEGAQRWADDFIAGRAGIRDSYMGAMTNMFMAQAQNFAQQGTQWGNMAVQEYSISEQAKANRMQGILGGLGMMFGMCHGAAEVFGWDTPEWWNARNWIIEGWKGRAADAFRAFYSRYSRQVAWAMRNIPGVKRTLTPFFKWAEGQGRKLKETK